MNVNYTGGARKTFRRYSSRSQQDITGTPAYHSSHRNSGRGVSSSRTAYRGVGGGKRRKTSHHSKGRMPEFEFAHARRDYQEEWGLQREARQAQQQTSALVHAASANRVNALLSGSSIDTRPSYAPTRPASHSSPLLKHPTSLSNKDTRAYFPPSANARPVPDSSAPLPTGPSSRSSNPATLSTIATSPVAQSETPRATPPPRLLGERCTSARSERPATGSNLSTKTNPSDTPAQTSILPSTSDQIRTNEAIPNRRLPEKEVPPRNDDSSPDDTSASLIRSSPKMSSPTPDPYENFYAEFERLVSQPSATFPQLPPRRAEWTGPCCATRFQRSELASSFIFTQRKDEEDESDKVERVIISDRMGLGCTGIPAEKAAELVERELALRNSSSAIDDRIELDDDVDERWKWLDWEEEDFAEDKQFTITAPLHSRSRLPPQPPSLSSFSPVVGSAPGQVTLSSGPWNANLDEDEPSLFDLKLNLDSSNSFGSTSQVGVLPSGISVDTLGDYEDVSTRVRVPHYPTAFDPRHVPESDS
ncbi:hypothetical protein JCM16303_004660 [Sporobolomyces ruberrimus]